MSFLTGTAPKVVTSTNSTVDSSQKTLLDLLSSLWGGTSGTSSDLSSLSLSGLEAQALGAPGATDTSKAQTETFAALDEALGYKAPKIDAGAAFQKGVVDPLTKTFNERTLPAIAGRYGTGAGGAFSSDAEQARRFAGEDLTKTLAASDAQYQYAADYANQQADIAGEGINLAGVKASSEVIDNPTKLLLSLLLGGQGGLTGAGSLATAGTQQTTSVAQGGSTGLLQGLAGGIAGNTGFGSAVGTGLMTLLGLSDRRVKDDVERVGEISGFPLYRFRYKGQPERHVGVMAQDVERRLPAAVIAGPGGVKMVNYGAVLADILEAA